VGFASGMIIGLAGGGEPEGSDMPMSGPQEGLLFGTALSVVGLVSGGVVGAFWRTDKWELVMAPRRSSRSSSPEVWNVGMSVPLMR